MGWILNCREAARLASREQDGPLPWERRLLLRAHLHLCGPCRRFLRQISLLHGAMQRYRS